MTTLSAALIARLHTIFAASAFFSAFLVGCALHYKKIVKNSVAGYPEEWFPSVSATCGSLGASYSRAAHLSFFLQNRRLVPRKKRIPITYSDYLRYRMQYSLRRAQVDVSEQGPRFSLVLFQYSLHFSPSSYLPTLVFFSGIIRTLSCGGWVYVTSTDDHDIHDVMMIIYIICNIPWMLVGYATTPSARVQVRKQRFVVANL